MTSPLDALLEWIAAHPARFLAAWMPLAVFLVGLLDSVR